VSMDNTPGSRAKASYFFPGTAINAVPNAQGVAVSVPVGVEARYPGSGTASNQVGGINDGVATQAGGGTQSAQAAEGYAIAQAALGTFQFAPTVPQAPTSPPSLPGVPGVPTVPPVPTLPPVPTSPAATPGSTPATAPTPSPTPHCVLIFCLSSALANAPEVPKTAQAGLPTFTLPDLVQQQLATNLKLAQLSNPDLLKLAGGLPAATDPKLPYASADASSQAVTRATNDGVTVSVVTRAQHVELLQGLITFASVNSTLQATAPASSAHGTGTIETQITGAAIGGIPVIIDQNGLTVKDQNASPAQIQSLSDQLNAALKAAGVQVHLTKSTVKSDAGFWEGSSAGVEVTAELNPAALNLPCPPPPPTGTSVPCPYNGIPGTHVDFTLGAVNASIYATPGDNSGSGSGGGSTGGGGGCFFCGGFGGGGGSSGDNGGSTSTTTTQHGSGSFLIPGGLHGWSLVFFVFIVQGLSTGVVAATAGYAESAAKAAAVVTEEESR
ncbi:MAG TPA: hypothetical protein VF807_11990, partial [Ktedonobacterales bacterium]